MIYYVAILRGGGVDISAGAKGMVRTKRMLERIPVPEEENPNQILAEIIVSKKVGGLHLRRVGEILVAREEMNHWLYTTGNRELSSEEYIEITERVLELEEVYMRVWRECESAERQWRLSVGLPRLDAALREAAEYFGEIGRK
ncbi:hypothetical protein [Streptomyces sp. NPDC091215]|uniref:hypothetical protein n=1 Tax=Streptomyces sp. NPDC091215 TaxID=3155192 RepID=UPI003449F520